MDRIQDFEVNSPRWLSLENFAGEIWKQIQGYEGLYEISNYGRVKNTASRFHHNKILKALINKSTIRSSKYLKVSLFKNGTLKNYFIHRLVAIAFIPNPNNLPFVNHKDENGKNPCVYNLEWCTSKYNSNYGTSPERIRQQKLLGANFKEIHQYSLDGEYIATYASQTNAERILGINKNSINNALRGKVSQAGGFLWTYTKEKEEIMRKLNTYTHCKYRKHIRMTNIDKKKVPIWRCKKIIQLSLDGIEISRFDSLADAERSIGVCYNAISRCLHGKSQSSGGFKWKFSE